MEQSSNLYALAALRERRAAIAGEITQTEARLRHLRESAVHIDATLRMFDPDADPSKIKGKKPYKRVKLFGAGKLNRLIMDALRNGSGPMTLGEIVEAICAELKFGPDAAKGMTNRVRANLLYLTNVRGQTIKEGERKTAIWRLAGDH